MYKYSLVSINIEGHTYVESSLVHGEANVVLIVI